MTDEQDRPEPSPLGPKWQAIADKLPDSALVRQARDFDRRLRMEVAASDEAWEAFISARTERIRVDVGARVRAEVAEEIARALTDRADSERESALATPPEAPRERVYHGTRCIAFGRAAEIARLAAGSSPDTTPEPASRCGVCGGQLGVQGCVRRCNTTPEPKRRYPRTSELTDQERYEIEEAAAAHRAEVDPDEVDRRDG